MSITQATKGTNKETTDSSLKSTSQIANIEHEESGVDDLEMVKVSVV